MSASDILLSSDIFLLDADHGRTPWNTIRTPSKCPEDTIGRKSTTPTRKPKKRSHESRRSTFPVPLNRDHSSLQVHVAGDVTRGRGSGDTHNASRRLRDIHASSSQLRPYIQTVVKHRLASCATCFINVIKHWLCIAQQLESDALEPLITEQQTSWA